MFDWITGLVERSGYLGVAVLMFLENVFPPMPSELIMPFAGFVAAKGDLHLGLVIAAGSAGSLAGAVFWYLVGMVADRARLKRWSARYGRWLTLHPDDVDSAFERFDRHAASMVFFGRLIPAIRTIISAPAGACRMRLTPFLVLTSLGTGLWTTGLTVTGYLLESQYRRVESLLDPVSTLVLVLLVAWYVIRVIRFRAAGP